MTKLDPNYVQHEAQKIVSALLRLSRQVNKSNTLQDQQAAATLDDAAVQVGTVMHYYKKEAGL
jgi:hypothetical protein